MKLKKQSFEGSTLVVVISVVALLLVLLGMAMEYTGTISRVSQRSRKTALAMEIADGHLEMLFTSWRNIYRTTWTTNSNNTGGTDLSILGTNYFFTSIYNPGPAPTAVPGMTSTPDPFPTPNSSNFPSESNYQLTQYRIQAVDPMISLDGNENALMETSFGSQSFVPLSPSATPPKAYGKNEQQRSYFYLASVDVTVPTSTGNVKAKVRRVFEKKFDNPWTYAMFFVDDLELQPTTSLTVNGPIHTNAGLYISTSLFTTTNIVEYGSEYVNGYAPTDSYHGATPSKPNFAKSDASLALSDMPPAQVSPYLPFGWNLKLANADGSVNNDSYHELIEQAVGTPDPLSEIRLYNQACYRILIDASNNITVTKKDGTVMNLNNGEGKIFKEALTTVSGGLNQAIQDQRENTYVRLATLDLNQVRSAAEANNISGWNGVIYIADTSTHGTVITAPLGGTGATVNTTIRAIRLVNGYRLPTANGWNGLTVVSANPVYIKGNYNTSTASGDAVPSNSGTYTDPDASGYTRKMAAVIGDSINVLSGNWTDLNSTGAISSRSASNTTINAALVGGIVPSAGGNYSGGGENFVRLLEDWKNNTLCIYGSMVQLYTSKQAASPWVGTGNNYKAPLVSKFYWDPNFGVNAISGAQVGPPGNLQIAAYLQQQRWFQVY
jgi:type II secretory pathway pseudopilin PulG